jgi:subtilisin family serine protease
MLVRKLSVLFISLSYFFLVKSSEKDIYLICFTDKHNTPFSLEDPERYLSEKAIEKRQRFNIIIDSLDLPVDPEYQLRIISSGAEIINRSKWLNAVTVLADSAVMSRIVNLRFVKEIEKTGSYLSLKQLPPPDASGVVNKGITNDLTNGYCLHDLGYRGKGIDIAVIDAGFSNIDSISAFDSLRSRNGIRGFRNFVPGRGKTVEGSWHGISVLGILAGKIPDQYSGTAPDASYWLLSTEDRLWEYPAEEDFMVAALEFADSAGTDIANVSLGYHTFKDDEFHRIPAMMDGRTSRSSVATQVAAAKGMLIIVSAGNEGNKKWKQITSPGDSPAVLTVGAVDKNNRIVPFSSVGPTADGRVKPEIYALGKDVVTLNGDGKLILLSGTSFATPIITGFCACLWQAFPELTNWQMIYLLKTFARIPDGFQLDDGSGIPDFERIFTILSEK